MNKKWFTLIEIMIWILISSMIIIIWFQALNSIMIWKVKLIESTNIEKESFSFMQKFFEEIKAWGLIDYEEYFNRKVVWNTTYLSWHFLEETGFWNYWTLSNWFYYCRSWNNLSNKMTWTWCLENTFNNSWQNQIWEKQIYGQYSFQFIDYNSNYDTDLWDEDWDLSIIWDDDDEYLGMWPEVFTSGSWVTELYLISADKTKRTLFRWTINNDINAPSTASCTTSDSWKTYTWSGCLWTIEFLRLEWKDWWFDHDIWIFDIWQYDWVIDTWLIDKDFAWVTNIVAWSNSTNYRLPLFPNSMNVKLFDIKAYPNKDIKLAWKETNWIDVSPYVRINLTLTPSWKVKKKIKGKAPEFEISTTINLTDIFSR